MHSAVEQSVESMRAAAAGHGLPSESASSSNRRPREQPGEAQEAPFSDRLVHRGLRMMQMAVLERFWRGLAVIFGGQRLVGTVAELVGRLVRLGTNRERLGSVFTCVYVKVTTCRPPWAGPRLVFVVFYLLSIIFTFKRRFAKSKRRGAVHESKRLWSVVNTIAVHTACP